MKTAVAVAAATEKMNIKNSGLESGVFSLLNYNVLFYPFCPGRVAVPVKMDAVGGELAA